MQSQDYRFLLADFKNLPSSVPEHEPGLKLLVISNESSSVYRPNRFLLSLNKQNLLCNGSSKGLFFTKKCSWCRSYDKSYCMADNTRDRLTTSKCCQAISRIAGQTFSRDFRRVMALQQFCTMQAWMIKIIGISTFAVPES